VLIDPNSPTANEQTIEAQTAADALKIGLSVLKAGSVSDIDAAFATLVRQRINGLIVSADPFFDTQRDQLIVLAGRHLIPAIYHLREFPASGGLMSYGISLADSYRQVGVYAARILKGDKTADLPVVQPTKFDLVINLITAKALGLDVPPTLLARADEVIE
jgi:putative ABC transport system substrate-binding protein